jgi:arabinose-5-phosphate isomerase
MPMSSRTAPISAGVEPGGADEVSFIRGTLRAESAAIAQLESRVGPAWTAAVDVLERCGARGGSVVVTGLGKSGLVGAKISATLASLGTPSHFLHPSEAAHGDLGRVRRSDCVLALSHSGETEEVVALAAVVRQDGIPIVSITGGEGASALARLSTANVCLGEIDEAGHLALAPTCSTTAAQAVGDALALAVARRRSFSEQDFARRHPGGALGGLLRPVVDTLRFVAGRNLPVAREDETVRAALGEAESTGRRPGALLVVDARGALAGIFTDGDLRRLVLRDAAALDERLGDVMTRSPRTLASTALVRDAVRMVREHRADEIPVVDAEGRPVGLLDVQDLMALRVVRDEPGR